MFRTTEVGPAIAAPRFNFDQEARETLDGRNFVEAKSI
jgi:hypothetical protein